jgi:LPS-assembly protein
VLKGHVIIKREDATMTSDEAEYNGTTSKALLRGNVRYEDKHVIINSESAEINTSDKTGTISNATIFFKKDNYHVNAERAEKTGENSYILDNATFTTCDAPLPAWCFNSSGADVTVGDRLKAGDVVFRIKGVPVLYTPYLWAPVLTERTSGLLFPTLGYKKSLGYFYKQPLYLVLADNRDATLDLGYFSERGFGEGLEYRYVERGGISGVWNGYHVSDRVLGKDFYELKALHTQFSEEGFSHFLNLNLINDRDFYQTYGTDVQTWAQRFLESSGSVSYSASPLRYYVSGQYWYDLQFENSKTLQKLPSAGISLHPVQVGPALVSFDARADNFYSSESYRVQRYTIAPSVALGVGDPVHFDQEATVAQSFYDISNTDAYPATTERTLFTYSAGVNTSFVKKYQGATHALEPEIRFAYATDSRYDAPALDASEAVTELSDIILSLDNRIVDKGGLFFSFKLSQPYNLRMDNEPLKPLRADFSFQSPLTLRFELDYDHYVRAITVFNGEASFNPGWAVISAGQRYDRENNILSYTGGLGFNITKELRLNNSIMYDAKGGGAQDITSSAVYTAQCWGITVTYSKRPRDYSIMLAFELKGLGNFKVGGL